MSKTRAAGECFLHFSSVFVFDQPERAQGPIYVINYDKVLSYFVTLSGIYFYPPFIFFRFLVNTVQHNNLQERWTQIIRHSG